MKMKTMTMLLAVGLLLSANTHGHALPFSVTNTINNGNGMQLTFGNSSDNFYATVFQQTITFSPALGSFNSASLDVTYSDIATTGELFAAYLSSTGGTPSPGNLLDYVSVGTLPGYDDSAQHKKTFDLGSVLPTIPANGLDSWTLYVAFRETTSGNDKMTLWNLKTYGDYNQSESTAVPGGDQTPVPTPEPSTMALLGLGLAGIGIAARRRKNN